MRYTTSSIEVRQPLKALQHHLSVGQRPDQIRPASSDSNSTGLMMEGSFAIMEVMWAG